MPVIYVYTLHSVALCAITLQYQSYHAPAARGIGGKTMSILRAVLRMEDYLGFHLCQSYMPSPSPTIAGRAWTASAMRVVNKASDVYDIAVALRNDPTKPSTRFARTKIESLLDNRKRKGALTSWLMLKMQDSLGFLNANGLIMQPHIEELCGYARQLQDLENELRRLYGALPSANASSTT